MSSGIDYCWNRYVIAKLAGNLGEAKTWYDRYLKACIEKNDNESNPS